MSHRRSGRRSGKKKNKSRRTMAREKHNKAKHLKELRRQLKKRQNAKVSEKRRLAAEAGRREAMENAAAARRAEWQRAWQPRRDSGYAWFRRLRGFHRTDEWSAAEDVVPPNLTGLLRRLINNGSNYADLAQDPLIDPREAAIAGGAFLTVTLSQGLEVWLPTALTEHERNILRLLASVRYSYRSVGRSGPRRAVSLEIAIFTARQHGNLPEADPWGLKEDPCPRQEWRPPTDYAAPPAATA